MIKAGSKREPTIRQNARESARPRLRQLTTPGAFDRVIDSLGLPAAAKTGSIGKAINDAIIDDADRLVR